MLARAGNAGQHLTQLGPDPRAEGPPHLLRDCPGTGPDHNGRLLFACVIAGQAKSWVADANGRVGFQGRLHSRAPAEVGGQQASTRRRVGAGWRDAMASAAPMTEKRGKSRGGGSGGLGRWEGEGTWAGMAGWTGGSQLPVPRTRYWLSARQGSSRGFLGKGLSKPTCLG